LMTVYWQASSVKYFKNNGIHVHLGLENYAQIVSTWVQPHVELLILKLCRMSSRLLEAFNAWLITIKTHKTVEQNLASRRDRYESANW